MKNLDANGAGILPANSQPNFEVLLAPYLFIDIPEAVSTVLSLAKEHLPASRVDILIDASMRARSRDALSHRLMCELLEKCAPDMPREFLHDLLIKSVRDFVEKRPRDLIALGEMAIIFEQAYKNVNPTVATFVLKALGSQEQIHVRSQIEKILKTGVLETLDDELIGSILDTWSENENPLTQTYARTLQKAGIEHPKLDNLLAGPSAEIPAL